MVFQTSLSFAINLIVISTPGFPIDVSSTCVVIWFILKNLKLPFEIIFFNRIIDIFCCSPIAICNSSSTEFSTLSLINCNISAADFPVAQTMKINPNFFS